MAPVVKSSSIVGDTNKNMILELIRKEGPISRADISRRLDICKPAVSANVKALLDAKVLIEMGPGNNALGKKSKLLEFNSNKAFVVGVDIGCFMIRVALSNLGGDILNIHETEHENEKHGERVLEMVSKDIDYLLHEQRIAKDGLLALGIGIPGIREINMGKNMLAPFMDDWEDIDIEAYFREIYKTRIIIENNVNTGAIGEIWKGVASQYHNVVYINFGKGIGAGIILNKELFRGKNNAAGEIGFCTVKESALSNQFQQSGVLEKLISTEYIIARYNTLRNECLLLNLIESMSYIFDQYELHEAVAVTIIEEVLNAILRLLTNLTAILNPEVIIFGGGLGERLGKYFAYFINGLEKTVPFIPELMVSKCGVLSGLYGAVAMALHEVNSDYKNLYQVDETTLVNRSESRGL